MKVCVFGKFPPIQGGVSTRTYWLTHELAKLGNDVHVITNAREVNAPYRMYMRAADWSRCDRSYEKGFVKVHWTESYGKHEWHIPSDIAHVTKLASIGLQLAREQQIDLVYSHYLEPYSVAGDLVARMTGLPHIVRTAGSDAGRLWRLPQYRELYNEIFRSAEAVICNPAVASQLAEIGVGETQIVSSGGKHDNLIGVFCPEGPQLSLGSLRKEVEENCGSEFDALFFGDFDASLSYFGVYGKLGRDKGTYALLSALQNMKLGGQRVGLLVMAHERPSARNRFRELVKSHDLEDRVFQIPFLPHWRVPEFIRACVAVCCLEQEFPIKFHNPVVAREVLTCGGCLVGSSELIGKLPEPHRLVDDHNCIVVSDVYEAGHLERRLTEVLEMPDRVQQIRDRARQYGIEVGKGESFALRLAAVAAEITHRRRGSRTSSRPSFALSS
jgi:glycosyltransferase involved in cell wall biosynthesis